MIYYNLTKRHDELEHGEPVSAHAGLLGFLGSESMDHGEPTHSNFLLQGVTNGDHLECSKQLSLRN